MEQVNILHIIHWPNSGITNLLYNVLTEQKKEDLNNHVIFFKRGSGITKIFSEAATSADELSNGVYSLRSIRTLRDRIKTISPDIIHVHSFLPHLYITLLKGDIPVVRTIHSDYPYFYKKNLVSLFKRNIEYYLLMKSSVIVSVSKSLTEKLQCIFGDVNIKTIPNGINMPQRKGSRQNVRQILSIPDKSLVFISVGRLEAQKGFDILVKAFSRSLSYSKNIYLLILGEGSQYDPLREYLTNNNLNDNIKLLGYQKEPYMYMEASDIYITSARYEGFGLAVAEAQGIGLPVIGFNVTGVSDVVVDGVTGILETKLDAHVLEKLVCYACENRDGLVAMGSAGIKHIESNFTIHQTAKKYFDLYNNMLSVSNY